MVCYVVFIDWNMSSQSGETLTLAEILPRFIMSPLRSVVLARTETTSWRNPGSNPRLTSNRVFPSTSFVFPDLCRMNLPMRPSGSPFMRQKSFWSVSVCSGLSSLDGTDVFFTSTTEFPCPGNVSGSCMRNICGVVRWKKS